MIKTWIGGKNLRMHKFNLLSLTDNDRHKKFSTTTRQETVMPDPQIVSTCHFFGINK